MRRPKKRKLREGGESGSEDDRHVEKVAKIK